MEAAGDLSGSELDRMLQEPEKAKGSLDDLFAANPKAKPEWPSG